MLTDNLGNVTADYFSRSPVRLTFIALILVLGLSIRNANAVLPVCHAPTPVNHSAPDQAASHIANCSALDLTNFPPTFGTHYPNWAKFQTYTQPVSPGYWLHSAEHGAVIILYKCPAGCAEEIAVLKTFIETLPVDTLCANHPEYGAKRRVLLAPDLRPDSAFTVVAWGWSLRSNCLDTAAIRAFYLTHYAQSYEDICYPGIDYSGSRWCNETQLGIGRDAEGEMPMARNDLLWEGSLATRVNLVLEINRVDGTRIKAMSLGTAGPGPYRAVWNPRTLGNSRYLTQPVLCRVKSYGTNSLGRILVEKIILP